MSGTSRVLLPFRPSARDDGSTRWRTFIRVCPACLYVRSRRVPAFISSRIFACGRRRFISPPSPLVSPRSTWRAASGNGMVLSTGTPIDRSIDRRDTARSLRRDREGENIPGMFKRERRRRGRSGFPMRFRFHVFVCRSVERSMIRKIALSAER